MGFLGEMLFGRREKVAMLIHMSPSVISAMDAYIYLHNAENHEMDHITEDDVIESCVEFVMRRALQIRHDKPKTPPPTKPKKQNLTPVFYADSNYSSGRHQARDISPRDPL